MRGLLFFGLNDVIAELRLDGVGDLTGVQREGGLVKLGNGDAVLQHAKFAAAVLRAGIVGVLLGERRPIAAGTKLLEHIFRLRLRGSIGLCIRALGHRDEDVADLDLVGDLVVLEVLLVVLPRLLIRDLRRATGHLIGREGDVADLARFGNGVLIAGGVLLEELLEISVGGIDLLAQVLAVQHGVIELDLGVVAAVVVGCVLVGDEDAAGDERLETGDLQLSADLLFKGSGGHVQLLVDEIGVAVLADELAFGEEVDCPRPVPQLVTDVVGGDLESQFVCLLKKDLALDERLSGLRHEKRDGLLGIVALLRDTTGDLRNFLIGDVARAAKGEVAAEQAGRPDRGVDVGSGAGLIRKDAGHQGDDHGDAGDTDDEPEDDLDGFGVFLQEANHEAMTTFRGETVSGAAEEVTCCANGRELRAACLVRICFDYRRPGVF